MFDHNNKSVNLRSLKLKEDSITPNTQAETSWTKKSKLTSRVGKADGIGKPIVVRESNSDRTKDLLLSGIYLRLELNERVN